MFGIGGLEFVLILLFAFLIFGPDKLPEIATTVGKFIAKFRKAQAEMNTAINDDVKNIETAEQPFQKSVEAFDKFGKSVTTTVKETVTDVTNRNAASSANASNKNDVTKTTDNTSTTVGEVQNGGAVKTTSDSATAVSVVASAGNSSAPKRESFTERKARYDREQAEKRAAEEKAAQSKVIQTDAGNNVTSEKEGE